MGILRGVLLTATVYFAVISANEFTKEHPATKVNFGHQPASTGISPGKANGSHPNNRNKDISRRIIGNVTSPIKVPFVPPGTGTSGFHLDTSLSEGTHGSLRSENPKLGQDNSVRHFKGFPIQKNGERTSVHTGRKVHTDESSTEKSEPSVGIVSDFLIVPTRKSIIANLRTPIPSDILNKGSTWKDLVHSGAEEDNIRKPDEPVDSARKYPGIRYPVTFPTETGSIPKDSVTAKSVSSDGDNRSREIQNKNAVHAGNTKSTNQPLPKVSDTKTMSTSLVKNGPQFKKPKPGLQLVSKFHAAVKDKVTGTSSTTANNQLSVSDTDSVKHVPGRTQTPVLSSLDKDTPTKKVTSNVKSTMVPATRDKLVGHDMDISGSPSTSKEEALDETRQAEDLDTAKLLPLIKSLQAKIFNTFERHHKTKTDKPGASSLPEHPVTNTPKHHSNNDTTHVRVNGTGGDSIDHHSKGSSQTTDSDKPKSLKKLLEEMVEALVPLAFVRMTGMSHSERVNFVLEMTKQYKAAILKFGV